MSAVVDAHCHVSTRWFEPVEILLAQMDRNDVEHAVLVQIRGQWDNDYQFACVDRHPDRLVSVVAVDPDVPDGPRRLERLRDRGARGLRLWFDAGAHDQRSSELWHAAAELGLPVSCVASAADYGSPDFARLVTSLPDLPVMLEHLGTLPPVDRDGVPDATRAAVLALADLPNVYVKFHGLGEFARRAPRLDGDFPFQTPVPPLIRQAYDVFGPDRMMWGSDFPPVSAAEGYANALQLAMDQLHDIDAADRALVFAGTAARLHGIGLSTPKRT